MKKIIYIFIAFYIVTIYPYNIAIAQTESEYYIDKVNNPYPGYIYFDIAFSPGFKKLDNYNTFFDYDDVSKSSPYFKVLRNGNIAQIAGESNLYYIYNKDMVLIDSVLNPTDHILDMHDFIQLRNGNYLLLLTDVVDKDMSKIIEGGQTHARVHNNYLVETKGKGDIIWQWSGLDHYDMLDVTEDIDLTQNIIDFTHINTLDEDKNGNILVSVRHYDEISLINKATGDFVWRMGGFNCKNNQFTFVNDNNNGFFGFSHQHTTEFLENGNLLVFDNGNLKSPKYSRAVEYSLDLKNMTATNVWEYRATPDIYTQAMGSAFRLPNGNTLISWSFDEIIEVKPDKSIALRIKVISPFPIYRAFKVFDNTNYATQKLDGNKEYNFSNKEYNTDVKINVKNAAKSKENLYVQKHNYAPIRGEFDDTVFTAVLPYRWVLSTDGDSFGLSGTIKFNLTNIKGYKSPQKLIIYKRDKEDSGVFRKLETNYNQAVNEISATFDGFGEFVIAAVDLLAPELKSPKNNSFAKHSDRLLWEMVFGAENYNVQLSTNKEFSGETVADAYTDNLFYDYSDLEYNTDYYWRVRSYNKIDTSSWSEVFKFTTEIEAPKIISPEDKFVGVKLDDKMIWTKVKEADRYQVQISQFYNFNIANLLDTITEKNEYDFYDLSYSTTYYVRLKSLRGNDSSSWSDVFEFTTILQSPNLALPKDEEVNVAQSYLFKWFYVEGVKFYEIQLSESNDFANILIEKSEIKENEYKIDDLSSNTEYYWRVRAMRDSDTSAWSQVFQFTTIIDIPILEYPENMQSSVEVNPLLRWQGSKDFDYHIQLAENINSNEFIIDTIVSNFISFQVAELKPLTSYEWRVKSINGESNSEWSDIFIFITRNSGDFLKAPILLSPQNNSEAGLPLSLVWNRVENAKFYRVQLSNSEVFDNILIDKKVETLNNKIEDLEENSNYFWRVRAISLYDSSAWSEVYSLKIETNVKAVSLLTPINEELQVPRNSSLNWIPIVGVSYYEVQLAIDKEFVSMLANETVYSNMYNFSGLEYNTQYYWRVRFSKDGEIAEWSEPWTFRTVTTKVLKTPKIIIPKENEAKVPIEGIMAWEAVEDADSYMLSISTLDDKTTYIYKLYKVSKMILEYEDLDYETTYTVKIAAFNDTASSSWSEPITFMTELSPPKIISPIDKAKNLDIVGKIEWEIRSELYHYHIQFSSDRDFNEILIDEQGISGSIYNYHLDVNKTYFVRVKAYNQYNESTWSDFVRFNTDTLGTSVNMLSEIGINIYPNPASDYLIIDNDVSLSSDVILYDINGNIRLKYSLQAGNNRIDLQNIKSGTYFIQIDDKTYKIIINK